VITEFISFSPGVPLVASIMHEAHCLLTNAAHGYLRHGGITSELGFPEVFRRSLLETHFNKEKRK
jgi:hypothetical protein